MLVDKTEFEAWMERIMGELYRISRKLDKAENRQKHLNYLNGERLYDNQDVCLLLNINCCVSASARSSDTGTTGR